MDLPATIAEAIELHSVETIRDCFSRGLSPNSLYRSQPLIYELTSEYTRSARFKDCVQAFVEYGLQFPDQALLAVLLDDAAALESHLQTDPSLVSRRFTLRCAYTPLNDSTLLHICAEFNHVHCARKLVEYGADINARAGLDKNGFGGQTPVFHTVNQNNHQSADMLHYLLSINADLLTVVKGFVWGQTYEWETFIPAVNAISYAMMGLLPQMHRNPETVAEVVRLLMRKAYGIDYQPPNVPNQYLR